MDDAIRLLQLNNVTPVGIVLAGFFLFALSLRKDWIVTGNRFTEKVKDCDDVNEALRKCTETNAQCRDDYATVRINIARLEERERVHRTKGRGAAQ